MTYHQAVMPDKALDALDVKPGGVYVDATFGGGGHSLAILERLGSGKLVAFDQDDDAAKNVLEDKRLLFLNHNFRYMKNLLKYHACIPVDGILADLGVSSHQFDEALRGFSIRSDGPLDMRMNRFAKVTAADIINTYDNEKLADVFYYSGELRAARKIAGVIEKQREQQPIKTTAALADAIRHLAPRGRENKFLAQVFQALRIEVNQELEALKAFLRQSLDVLKPGGRLVVISYHSLEDRLVKNFMRTGSFEGELEKDFYGNPQTPWCKVSKAIKPDPQELERNKRARSARLRVAEKTKSDDSESV